MIRRNKPKGPNITVPGAARSEPPPTGAKSFAKRVRSRRKKQQAGAPASTARPSTRPQAERDTSGKPKTQRGQTVLPKEARLAAAAGVVTIADQPSAEPTTSARADTTTPSHTSIRKSAEASPRTAPASPKPQRDPDPGYVAVGRIQGPFGLKGEVKVLSLTDNPDRFSPKSKLWAGQHPVSVVSEREASGYVYLTLKGFPSRTSVEKFRNALLQVPEEDLPELEEGEFYRFQLIGLTVVDLAGEVLGTIAEVIETGATDVYRVKPAEGADILLAATGDVVKSVDIAAKRMVADPPVWT
jgi:16S rRNA processing protein RimM